ncbi:type IV pilus assembly protein PilO [Dokdonella fugitiva]|uniref:Type IV pilus assembly protein PilO n=1 Tax=Dokdonella fugitiva TaxID=328517 RepID=A0A839F6H8_9GAMM|nr:type 4a pilus biogenesis protein PilO [Dokdonella fugitiva]MBA8889672.1 type IV pilus assembly protein PilO [Dokdonella fugitiva]
MSFFDDLRNLDRNNIGGWSKSVKFFFCAIIVALILFLGWYFKISVQQEDLKTAQDKELALKKEFSDKQGKVVNLEAYRKQLADMEEMLQTMLRQLPSRTEMPDLLNNITQAALSAGIETQLFQPGSEVMKDFYAEKPIQLKMLGTYHQFGTFISNVASLPRVVILTMHDVSLKPADQKASPGGTLLLEGIVKTYRYLDDDEQAAVAKAKNPTKPAAGAPPPKKKAGGE